MHVAVVPSGSRGDFQPLLALAVALRRAGHGVMLVTSPNFVSEAEAFGVPVTGIGQDILETFRTLGIEPESFEAVRALFSLGRKWLPELLPAGLEACQGADLVVGGGAQIAAPTVAEKLGVPYAYVAYTPQLIRSAHHPPFHAPVLGLPRFLNRALWASFRILAQGFLSGPLQQGRAALGLPPVGDFMEHFFPSRAMLLAADPELAPVPDDVKLPFPPTGALHLPDERPLPAEVEAFLAAGPAPVYLGFGSMPDRRPEETLETAVSAARKVGARLIVSAGWARLGGVSDGTRALADDVLVVGPLSHRLLFPRMSVIVHHGGAGTTSAAARAGVPQVVVPHVFDQFLWGRWVKAAGVGTWLARKALTARTLGAALEEVRGAPAMREQAAALGRTVSARDSGALMVQALEQIHAARR